MKPLNLPEIVCSIRMKEGKPVIFDVIRKKYVILTPEEWVRQHFIHYLLEDLGYPRSLTRVESGLRYNKMAKRSDIVVYNRRVEPVLIVECKSFEISLTQKVMNQAAMYNRQLRARILVITNGLKHYCVEYTAHGEINFLSDIPAWNVTSAME